MYIIIKLTIKQKLKCFDIIFISLLSKAHIETHNQRFEYYIKYIKDEVIS